MTAKLFGLLELQQNLNKDFLSMSICSILWNCVSKKNCLALVSGAMELALEWINLVLKCANSNLKSPN